MRLLLAGGPTSQADPGRSLLPPRPAGGTFGIVSRRAAGIWSTNDLMREAELELARQAETSYKRIVQDQQAGGPAKKAGASVTLERA